MINDGDDYECCGVFIYACRHFILLTTASLVGLTVTREQFVHQIIL